MNIIYLEDYLPQEFNPKIDDASLFLQTAVDNVEQGGTLYFFRNNAFNIILKKGIKINKSMRIIGNGFSDSKGIIACDFDDMPYGESAFKVSSPNGIGNLEISNFYLYYFGTNPTGAGIEISGTMGTSPINGIWYANVKNVWINGFYTGLSLKNVILPKIEDVRCILSKSSGFSVSEFSTGVKFSNCYAERGYSVGFFMKDSLYSTFDFCHSDGNTIGYIIRTSNGISISSCSAEYSRQNSISNISSFTKISSLTTVGSGSGVFGQWIPSIIYISGGQTQIESVCDFRSDLTSPDRYYSILGDSLAKIKISKGNERLPYYFTSGCTVSYY